MIDLAFRQLTRQRLRWDRSLVRFRVRKHGDLFSWRNRNFTFSNFFTALDNIVFNLILNLKWWVYFLQMIIFYRDMVAVIFAANYFFYLFSNWIEFAVACWLCRRTMRGRDYLLAAFVPLMPFYTGLYLRFVRTFAHLIEFVFRASYFDAWNPWKVSRIVRRQKI